MDIYLYYLRIHQLAVFTRLQVDQTCPVGYILSRLLRRRIFKDLNQSENCVMDVIGERFGGVFPPHGGTQQPAILLSFIFYASLFNIKGHL